MAFEIFDLIHCDVWGPFHTPTYHGKRFFLSLVDDHSRFTWVYLMTHKSEAPTIIKRFFALVETQFHKVIKTFGFDNAKELHLTDFLANKRMIHLQQNAVVERKHYVARSLYFQAKLPLSFLG